MQASALYHIDPKKVSLRDANLPTLDQDQILIQTQYSAISAGTECLIFDGKLSSSLEQDKTISSLRGTFDYPFRYGYALVGQVVDSGKQVNADWQGRRVFAFHPHQNYAVVSINDSYIIPEGISPQSALFLANIESALNFVMDSGPVIGEKVIIFGQGVVGLLTTALLSDFPLSVLIAADPLEYRRKVSLSIGAKKVIDPTNISHWTSLKQELLEDNIDSQGLDLCFELSGNMDALNQAIGLTGFAGRIIIGSWYGSELKPVHLGTDFHRRRIQLISSQVSTVNPVLSGRWNKHRRINLAWALVRKIKPERLISHTFSIDQCQKAFELVSQRSDNALQIIFEYP